eukprot:scaffold907_cov33-Cyclotella_meneghiniana.AAC.1
MRWQERMGKDLPLSLLDILATKHTPLCTRRLVIRNSRGLERNISLRDFRAFNGNGQNSTIVLQSSRITLYPHQPQHTQQIPTMIITPDPHEHQWRCAVAPRLHRDASLFAILTKPGSAARIYTAVALAPTTQNQKIDCNSRKRRPFPTNIPGNLRKTLSSREEKPSSPFRKEIGVAKEQQFI